MATPWVGETADQLKARTTAILPKFTSPLKKFVLEHRLHAYIICFLGSQDIVDCWEIAGLADTQSAARAAIGTASGLTVAANATDVARSARFWLACTNHADNALTKSTRTANEKRVPEHFDPEDISIDTDTRNRAEKGFLAQHKTELDVYMQPHDTVLGIIKHDFETFNIRPIALVDVWLHSETKRDKYLNKKRKIAEGLSLVVDSNDDEVVTGGIYYYYSRLRALLTGYCMIGCLSEFCIHDPEDDRPEPERIANGPRFIPMMNFSTALNYADHFLRMASENVSGTNSRPSFEALLEAELATREWACKLVRRHHLKGGTISLSAALNQALNDCSNSWRFLPSQTLSAAHKAKAAAKPKKAGKPNNRQSQGNNKPRAPNPIWNDSNWKKKDSGEWHCKGTLAPPKGKGKGK